MEAGRLEIFIGPMFSGKTTRLVQRVRQLADLGLKSIIINSILDTRDEKLSSHAGGFKLPDNITYIKTHNLVSVDADKYEVIGIDEGQFFSDLPEIVSYWTFRKHFVFVSSLDGTFEQKLFGRVVELIPIAHHVEKLTAWCYYCLKEKHRLIEATCSRKITESSTVIDIGGIGKYRPVCLDHLG